MAQMQYLGELDSGNDWSFISDIINKSFSERDEARQKDREAAYRGRTEQRAQRTEKRAERVESRAVESEKREIEKIEYEKLIKTANYVKDAVRTGMLTSEEVSTNPTTIAVFETLGWSLPQREAQTDAPRYKVPLKELEASRRWWKPGKSKLEEALETAYYQQYGARSEAAPTSNLFGGGGDVASSIANILSKEKDSYVQGRRR